MERIIVQKGQCPLAEIAKKGEQTKNSWIFLKKNVIEYLKNTAIVVIEHNGYTFNTHGRIVRVRHFTDEWKVLEEVTIGEGIDEFKSLSQEPERIFIVEME